MVDDKQVCRTHTGHTGRSRTTADHQGQTQAAALEICIFIQIALQKGCNGGARFDQKLTGCLVDQAYGIVADEKCALGHQFQHTAHFFLFLHDKPPCGISCAKIGETFTDENRRFLSIELF